MRAMLVSLLTASSLAIVTLAPSQLRAAMLTMPFGFNGANGAQPTAPVIAGFNGANGVFGALPTAGPIGYANGPISGASSAVAITADSLTIGGCSSNQAIGGGVVGLYCAGDIYGTAVFPPSGNGSYQISIVARGDQGWGLIAPQARISIDGVGIGTIAVTTSSFSPYTISNVATTAGPHVIDIAFANGYSSPYPGFALYIQSVAITPTTDVPVPSSNPPTSADAYQQQLLNLINGSRAGAGLPPYTFSAVQSAGTANCVGSYGHSVHMEQVGQISHDQFPQDICIPWSAAGENVGEASGSESTAIQVLHQQMMSEGPSGGHYQNIMSTTFTTIGIGLYYSGGTLWLTEDFVK